MKRVIILRDASAPLHYMRCAEPCRAGGWCMTGPEGEDPPHCYLGGSMCEAGARVMAERAGYEVVG